MSARISKGDTVRCTHGEPDSGLFVGRNYEAKEVYVRSATGDAYIDIGVDPDGWRAERFEKVEPEHAEPEDKDDLYVEPEPLKAGDWALAWVRIEAPKPDKDGDVSVSVPLATVSEIESGVYFRADAIVRPDAGQVPPWVKPARCTSLIERTADSLPVLMRCEGEAGHQTMHVVGWVAWTDTEAYGRVEVSS